MIPRGLPRGLIEARILCGSSWPVAWPIPRGLPRGLIEALRRCPARRAGVAGFRGDFPAASLKHAQGECVYLPEGGIPRGLPRGLIEARPPPIFSPLPIRFRGDFPAASLKHEFFAVPAGLSHGRFRGDFPAASLKHVLHRFSRRCR